eukprot:568378-Amphidinium_carterae.1
MVPMVGKWGTASFGVCFCVPVGLCRIIQISRSLRFEGLCLQMVLHANGCSIGSHHPAKGIAIFSG